jgi:O-acetyl-ADP-ribose deacetylase (regulator of RNase III)
MQIEVVIADITTVRAEVLVTAANRALAGGGGVDGAIHRAAGAELQRALRPLAPCPAGSAVITPAFDLPAPVLHIIHAVGPRYGVDEPAIELLASAYLTSLRLCDDVNAASVAFPSLSTAAFGFPLLQACQISVATLPNASTQVQHRTLVLRGGRARVYPYSGVPDGQIRQGR